MLLIKLCYLFFILSIISIVLAVQYERLQLRRVLPHRQKKRPENQQPPNTRNFEPFTVLMQVMVTISAFLAVFAWLTAK